MRHCPRCGCPWRRHAKGCGLAHLSGPPEPELSERKDGSGRGATELRRKQTYGGRVPRRAPSL